MITRIAGWLMLAGRYVFTYGLLILVLMLALVMQVVYVLPIHILAVFGHQWSKNMIEEWEYDDW